MSLSAHLDEWQRRSFDISSGTCAPEQTADAYRLHLVDIQYAWASGQLSGAGAAVLHRTYSERYAAVLDSDDPRTGGLNNYADAALHLARGHRNHSDKWESSLTEENVMALPCVRKMMIQAASRGGGDSPVAPADAKVTVGREESSRGGSLSAPSSSSSSSAPVRASEPPLFKSTSSLSRVSEGISCNASSFSPHHPPRPAQTHVGSRGHAASAAAPPPQGNNNNTYNQQASLFQSVSNPAKRKNFYGSDRDGAPAMTRGGMNSGAQAGPEPRAGSFKTAREQLIADQHKKNTHQRGQAAPPAFAAHAAAKKSLGANRPRGTISKFVSPLPRQDEEQGDVPEEAQVVDERLKNFEPKIIELITSEIMDHGPPVAWDDIAGLEFAKATIKEIVVWPMLRPDIFTGLRGPPKGILLFGPPGTGKTLIGKCIACQSGATFFSISASSLTSKWVGEGEKMVRALFAVARCHQPAVVFIDEIDSLLSQRTDGEHDASRRIKTEFLVQLDGAATQAEDRVLVVGATNRPHEIDEAARRRLSKRLYVPLPEATARRQIVANLMAREKSRLSEDELDAVVGGTEGFSGADMTQLCREAALGPIRSIRITDIATIAPDQVRPILHCDFQEALKTVRPSVSSKDLEVYEEWNKTFGCGR